RPRWSLLQACGSESRPGQPPGREEKRDARFGDSAFVCAGSGIVVKNCEVIVDLSPEQKKELEIVERFHSDLKRIDHEVRKIIVGQNEVVDQVMISMLTGGHSIITGVPGLAKTLLIATVAQVLHLNFKRIQFTPDLMPADITGTEIIEEDRVSGKRVRV